MTKYLNFFNFESGFTEAVESDELFFPNVSYTEDDDTVHWNLTKPANPVQTPMLRMHFSTSSPGQEVRLRQGSGITAMEIDGTPVNNVSGGTYSIASPGNHTAVYQFSSSKIPDYLFFVSTGDPFSVFTSAEITSAVTSIGNLSFDRCLEISAVTIPDSVTTIGFQTFSVCSGLTSVTIPDSVTTIAFNAFEHTGLRHVTVPDSVTSLGHTCFLVCEELRSAVIGSGITALPNQTFGGCALLRSVTLPDNLTAIGEEAFLSCYSLYDINIPSGVTTIGEKAFYRCSGLTAIYLNPETPPTLGTGALDYTNDCPIYVPAAAVDTYKEAWPGYSSRIMPMGGVQYNITATVNDEDLGQVNLEQETASEGDPVDFEVEVFEMDRYQISSVSITDGNGDEVEYVGSDFDYSFTMPDSDVTIFVTIGEKPKYTVTVDSTDDMVTDVDFMSDDGEPSYREGDWVDFSFNLGEGLQAVSVQASDCDGNSIEAELEYQGDNNYNCYFSMPGCDVSVFITVEERPMYNITATVNDDNLGTVNVLDSAPEGGQVEFDVVVFEPEQYQISSVTCTDGNGDEVECTDEEYGDGYHHYTFTMPASDVTIEATIEPVE